MASPIKGDLEKTEPRPGRLAASLTATISFLRGLPLFVSSRPKTPLRVLCLMAFDTVHVLRNSRRLSAHTLQTLASLLDFGACANGLFDGKDFSRQEYRATRRLLDRSRTRVAVNEYSTVTTFFRQPYPFLAIVLQWLDCLRVAPAVKSLT